MNIIDLDERYIKMESITIESIRGEHIGQTIRTAIMLSAQYDCNIHFEFNDIPVDVDVRALRDKVYDTWARELDRRAGQSE